MLKKRYLLLILIVSLFALSAVSAADNDTVVMSNDYDSSLIAESVVGNESYGTFQDLQDEIDAVEDGGTLNLTRNYMYVNGSTIGVSIYKPMTINGQGYTIDGNQLSRILYINCNNVILKNINLVNGKYKGNGGAICWNGDNGFLYNCSFLNSGANEGGGIYSNDRKTLNIIHCNFDNCYSNIWGSYYGAGAIYLSSDASDVINSSFINCSSNVAASAIYLGGDDCNVINCSFINCTSQLDGGALFVTGTKILINNSSFIKNFGSDGSSIYWKGFKGNLTKCNFINNSVYYDGGAIYAINYLNVNNCNFINNTATHDGGAIYSYGSLNVDNCNFMNNSASITKDICFSTLNITNSTFIPLGFGNRIYYNVSNSILNDKNLISDGQVSGIENCTLIANNAYLVDIFAPNITKYYKGSERFIIIINEGNEPVVGGEVKIYLNGQTYTRTTDKNGQASMAINLDSGVYNVTTEYDELKVNSTITVNPTIIANDFTKIFRNETQYYGTFVDSQGNLLNNTKVRFNINGVFYDRTTDGNGVAKLNINLNPGTYILTATNLVNGENHATTITVLPNIIENHDLTKYYKNASQYVIKVLDDQGNPVSGQSVDFNVNGVFYTRTSNATGHVKMNINLNPGTYIITAIYKGFMTSNIITVKTVLEAKDLNMKFRDGSKFEAKLLDGEGNPFASRVVTFNINGILYERMTDIGGIARLNINLNPGSYIITSSYNGLNIANTIRIALDPIYYTIGSNPLDYNYYMNEYNRFTWDWYYSPQHEAMVRTIYDIYGNQGMEIQDQYVHYGTKYYCWDQSNRLDYRLNKDGEVISVTNMMDYYVDYKEYDYNNNELIYHNVYLPDYDAETTAEVEGYDVTVHQWRTPNFSEIDVIVRDKNGNMLDLYSYDTMILTDGTWYGPYDQVANAERSTYHKWHKSPNSRTTEVAVKIKAYVNLI